MKIGGLDIGTTGCKLTVFDENGDQLGKAYRDYPVRRAVSGHEIDLSTMMDSVYTVIREMADAFPDIGGIGVTSFGETFVMVSGAGEPLHAAMLYTDPVNLTPQREEDITRAAWVARSSLPPFLKNTYPSILEVFREAKV